MHTEITKRKSDGIFELNVRLPVVSVHGLSNCDTNPDGERVTDAKMWVVVAVAEDKRQLWDEQNLWQTNLLDMIDGQVVKVQAAA